LAITPLVCFLLFDDDDDGDVSSGVKFIKITCFFLPVLVLVDPPLLFLLLLMDNERLLKALTLLLLLQLIIIILLLNLFVVCFSLSLFSFFLKCDNETKMREISRFPRFRGRKRRDFSSLSRSQIQVSLVRSLVSSELSSLLSLVCESLLCSHTQVDDDVNDDIKELLDVNRYTE